MSKFTNTILEHRIEDGKIKFLSQISLHDGWNIFIHGQFNCSIEWTSQNIDGQDRAIKKVNITWDDIPASAKTTLGESVCMSLRSKLTELVKCQSV